MERERLPVGNEAVDTNDFLPTKKLGQSDAHSERVPKKKLVLPSAKIIKGDCLLVLKRTPKEKFDLVVSSPPYFIGKAYDTSRSAEEFTELHTKLFPELIRTLKPGGSLCWQIGYHVTDGKLIPLDYLVQSVAAKFPELVLRNRIIWRFRHGIHCKNRFSGRHEVILWFTKGDSYLFDLDAVRVPQIYPGKVSYKGEKKGTHSGNPLGKNPEDVWDRDADVWDIPNVKALHPEKTAHPCQFPTALVRRLVRALVPKNGAVLDPFAGAGSAGVAAVLEKRNFIGIERDPAYARIAKTQIALARAGKAKVREDVPVRTPRLNEAVSKRPAHFKKHKT